MNIKNNIISYLLTFVVFIVIDMLWLGVISKKIYHKYLGHFLTGNVNWIAAFIFYLIFVIGVLIFVIYPAVEKNSVLHAILMGALFGLVTYATYDLTNLATLNGWPLPIVIIDMIWGAVLTAIVSVSGYYIVRWIN